MNITDFLKVVRAVRDNCGLDCDGSNYYVFVHKDLKSATVNKTGYTNMSNVGYIIVVCPYKWKNWGYVNISLTQLMMVDSNFEPVDSIHMGEWNFKGLGFITFPGTFYNAWRPYPKMELVSDTNVNNYAPIADDEPNPFPQWVWPSTTIENATDLFKSIDEFVKSHKDFKPDNNPSTCAD